MSFFTPALLGGVALVAIPIVLHLIMRRQSQQFTFPALRFVRQRSEANRRRLNLRHILLLALRCMLVAGLAFALARPTLRATGLHGKEGSPLAVAVVVDNSLRMQYVRNGRTRLDEAADMAGKLVSRLPEDATVAVCDLGRAASGFAPDLSAAAARLQNLRPAADARPLLDALQDAIRLATSDEQRRPEVFVFTDLAAAAWSTEAQSALGKALADAPDARLYLVNVGVESPQNAALGPLAIRRSVLRPGEALHIEAPVESNLSGETPLVELSLQDADGELVKRGQQLAAPGDDGQTRVTFEIADLPLGTHQGAVQLAGADPLPVDNVRYFTVEVRPAARVLLLATQTADARFVREALAPSGRFDCQSATFDRLGDLALDDFQAVLLLDPPALDDSAWEGLWEYASGGGGVGVLLGHNADFKSFNAEAPQRLLPGALLRISREQTYLRPRRLDHPALAPLQNYAESIPWPACEVFSFWQFEQLADDAYEVAAFANDEPAVVERKAGRGRTLTLTTPFSDPLTPAGRDAWNVLPSPELAWPFVALCEELVGYLAQDADEQLDCFAGETVRMRLSPNQQVSTYVLRLPDGQAENRVTSAGESVLSIGVTEMLGNYRLTAGGEARRLDRGFSINPPADVSELAQADVAAILAALPTDRARVADDLENVLADVSIGRSGRELYSWAIALVTLAWTAEHVLANRFYRRSEGVDR